MSGAIAGDFDYERGGKLYATVRRTDPRIEAYVHTALGSAQSVLNVGAGAGSYEPTDRYVVAVEPSATMRAQRPGHAVPALVGVAEHLPFDDRSFDASMATLTVHQWPDMGVGLREMRRVTRGPVVVLTFDGDALDRFWLTDYVPELIEAERRRYPALRFIDGLLGGDATITEVPVGTRLPRWLHRGLLRPARGVPRGGHTSLAVGVGVPRRRGGGAVRGTTPRRPRQRRLGRALRANAPPTGLRGRAPAGRPGRLTGQVSRITAPSVRPCRRDRDRQRGAAPG